MHPRTAGIGTARVSVPIHNTGMSASLKRNEITHTCTSRPWKRRQMKCGWLGVVPNPGSEVPATFVTSRGACVFRRASHALGERGRVQDDVCRSSLFSWRGSGQSPPAADATLLARSAGFSSLASGSRPIRCIVLPVASVKYDRRAAQHHKSTKSSPCKL